MIICGYEISLIAYCLGMHWLLAFIVGVLAYSLILTILLRTSSFKERVGVFSTRTFSLLVALCLAVLSHMLVDYTVHWF